MSDLSIISGSTGLDSKSILLAVKLVCATVCAIPLALVANALSKIFSNLMNAIAQNPVILDKGTTIVIIGAALVEAIALLILVIALLVLFGQ